MVLFFYLLCLALWLGAIVFFSAFVAPVIFTRLPVAQAGTVVSVIFPRYYLLGYACGGLGLALAIYLAVVRGPQGWWTSAAVALAIALGITLYAGIGIRPQVDAIRSVAEQTNPDPARKAEFDRLHHLSVMLNGAVLLLDLFALISTAAALTPP
ncbi:MAG: DUF4149 domain-containing protein [Candidatus Binataceae bacterium]|nr:DUF4149 domain-containing protein [Candidatus Binataceae bacterium]